MTVKIIFSSEVFNKFKYMNERKESSSNFPNMFYLVE